MTRKSNLSGFEVIGDFFKIQNESFLVKCEIPTIPIGNNCLYFFPNYIGVGSLILPNRDILRLGRNCTFRASALYAG